MTSSPVMLLLNNYQRWIHTQEFFFLFPVINSVKQLGLPWWRDLWVPVKCLRTPTINHPTFNNFAVDSKWEINVWPLGRRVSWGGTDTERDESTATGLPFYVFWDKADLATASCKQGLLVRLTWMLQKQLWRLFSVETLLCFDPDWLWQEFCCILRYVAASHREVTCG